MAIHQHKLMREAKKHATELRKKGFDATIHDTKAYGKDIKYLVYSYDRR